jgi:hypothetical protein
VRAVLAVREKLEDVGESLADWLAERDRRRRQEAAFLRGLHRLLKTQAKVGDAVGLSQETVSRILDRDGHAKQRARKKVEDGRISNLPYSEPDEPEESMPTNVVKMRRRRRDWKPRNPRRAETYRWLQQFLEWNPAGA